MIATPPTSEEQVLFLRNVQRLLSEGQFTASYKLALLHAIADLCVIKGDDSGGELPLATGELAEKFIELYWQQCRPFQLGGEKAAFTLLQNKGSQAAIIRKISDAQGEYGSLFRLRQSAPDLWKPLVSEVKRTITEMPLWKLQTVGSQRLDFLYDNLDVPTATIRLKPGVAYCFRAFYGLMRDLIQGAWVRFVQKVNCVNLGNLTDLSTFLFDRERSSLDSYRTVLTDLQERRCFYCDKELHGRSDVDHFIPWTRYPTDLGHNFVLAHPTCNNAKSDFLGAESHLQRWAERNRTKRVELDQRLNDAGLPHELTASLSIAEWAYEQVENSRGQVWLARKQYQHLGADWRELLAL